MSADTKPEGLAALRESFPASQVGKLPKGGIELDYVGHGAVTARLLDVDPEWNWEPAAFDDQGQPRFVTDEHGNPIVLWIRLTVCGVTRLGCGTCGPKQTDAEKVLIGDAIRNAAMRFGVALDLWVRGHGDDDERRTANDHNGPSRQPSRPRDQRAKSRVENRPWQPKIDQIKATLDAIPLPSVAKVQAWVQHESLPRPEHLSEQQADQVLAHFVEQGYIEAAADAGEQQSLVEAGS